MVFFLELATLIGIIIAITSLICSALIEGTNLGALANPAALVMIIGGTIGATMASTSFKDFFAALSNIKLAFAKADIDPNDIVETFIELSEISRREGLLALEERPTKIKHPMLKRGVQLIVDGTDPTLLKSMLETEIVIQEERIKSYAEVYQAAGGYSPTMGIIGTVLGLVKVLGSLGENTEELGPAIATAFIATFFGISLANMVWLPIGKKIRLKAKETSYTMEMILEGLLSIQSGDNPRITREKLLMFANSNGKNLPAASEKGTEAI